MGDARVDVAALLVEAEGVAGGGARQGGGRSQNFGSVEVKSRSARRAAQVMMNAAIRRSGGGASASTPHPHGRGAPSSAMASTRRDPSRHDVGDVVLPAGPGDVSGIWSLIAVLGSERRYRRSTIRFAMM